MVNGGAAVDNLAAHGVSGYLLPQGQRGQPGVRGVALTQRSLGEVQAIRRSAGVSVSRHPSITGTFEQASVMSLVIEKMAA